jgi:hypothetical protein
MIVPSMTSKELLREILSDDKNVRTKAVYLSQGMRREVVKSKMKHACRAFEYRTKKFNNWIIVIDYHKKKQEFYSVLYYNDYRGFNAIQVNSQGYLTHFIGHFLGRYNERYLKLKDVTNLDLLKMFVVENPVSAVKYTLPPDSKKNIVFCRFKEGIGLGDEEVFETGHHIVHLKTYITNRMIHEGQLDDFEILGELYESEMREMQKNTRRRA